MVNRPGPSSRLYDLDGVRVGHWTDRGARTGCTVVMFDRSCAASCHVAGGAPGTQETGLLEPSSLVGGVDAILLTGGSAFGLEAAAGVRRYLEERGRGFDAAGHMVPIVPAAVIFDLAAGDGSVRPGPDEGYAACVDTESPSPDEGRAGAGTGATVGKHQGLDRCAPGGLASRSIRVDNGVSVGALMVANCFGSVIDPEHPDIVAGPRGDDGRAIRYLDTSPPPPPFGATALGVVVTDAKLTKAEANRVAMMAHDGLARTVSPSHTPYDGDIIFVVTTGEKKIETARLGAWAAYLVERSMVAAASLDRA